VLFGREDSGLPNEALDLAHLRVTIPTTAHASLNLAQAVLVALYELHTGAGDATRRLARPRKHAAPPTARQLELAFADAERALAALDFFKTRNAEYVMRSLRSLVFRAEPDGPRARPRPRDGARDAAHDRPRARVAHAEALAGASRRRTSRGVRAVSDPGAPRRRRRRGVPRAAPRA
jgi:hypothetical protein